MSGETERVREALLREAESMIDQLLRWEQATPKPTLSQLEDTVILIRRKFEQRLAEVVLAEQEASRPVPEPTCPHCGGPMRYKGQKELQVESLLGLLRLKPGYYWCVGCQVGFFPSG